MSIRQVLVEVVAVSALGIVGYMAYERWTTPRATDDGKSVETKAAPIAKSVKKTTVVMKKPLKTYSDEIKPKLKLPDAVQKDPEKHVAAATQIQSDLHPQTVSTVVDTKTGDVTTFTKLDPYPWLAYEPRGSVGVAYGLKYQSFAHGSHVVGRLQLEQELIRVKALKIGATASLDTDRDAFIGIGVKYQW